MAQGWFPHSLFGSILDIPVWFSLVNLLQENRLISDIKPGLKMCVAVTEEGLLQSIAESEKHNYVYLGWELRRRRDQ